jgi:isopentenyldiphosphate isomerase
VAEYIDIFDENWNPTGEVLEKSEAKRQGKWRLGVGICFINPRGELLLARRSPAKKVCPGMWDVSTGGHVHAGEGIVDAAIREVREELGVDISAGQLIELTKRRSEENHALQTKFLVKTDLPLGAFVFCDGEVVAVKYIPWRELAKMSEKEMLEKGIIPYKEYGYMFEYLDKNGF